MIAPDATSIRRLFVLGAFSSLLALTPFGALADEPAVLPADLPAEELPADEQVATPDSRVEVVESTSELIQERYPSGAIKVERRVAQDADGNYLNHGPWKMWDEKGTLLAEGEYRHGRREGTWNRWFRAGDAELFAQERFAQYQGPYVSQATFQDGRLDGAWTIYDAKQQKICEIEFADGLRHGKAIFWHANGQPMREVNYDRGLIDGQLLEWKADATLVVNDVYQKGRKLAPKVAYFEGDHKKSEGMYLHAQLVVATPDDWWNAKFASYAAEGDDQRHGPWTSWYPNGQVQLEGEFAHDVESGKFTWWYPNGQRSIEGFYKEGQQHGRWVWWHQNGQKSSQGDFAGGDQKGRWFWWHDTGRVAKSADYSQSQGEESVANLPEGPEADVKADKSDNNGGTVRF